MLRNSPRVDDVAVALLRAQPLGKDVYRLDFDVTLSCQGNQTVNTFRSIDVQRADGQYQYPARLILDAKCGTMPLNMDPGSDWFSLETWTNALDGLFQ